MVCDSGDRGLRGGAGAAGLQTEPRSSCNTCGFCSLHGAFALFSLPPKAKGVPDPAVPSSLTFHPTPCSAAIQPHFSPNVARRSGVGSRPRDASRLGMDEGTPATPAVPAVYPGLHGSSSGISPCARLIPATGSTPGARELGRGSAGPGGKRRVQRQRAGSAAEERGGGGAPGKAGPGTG